MSRKAWVYVVGVLFAGTVLSGLTLLDLLHTSIEWPTFITLIVLATVAQLFEAEHGRQSYYPHFVFFFAGVVLLPSFLLVMLVAIPHLVEWGKELLTPGARRRKWYIQPFNIAAHVIPGLCALGVYNAIISGAEQVYALAPLLAAVAAIITYIGMNHVMVGLVLVLARSISWKESGVLKMDCLVPDPLWLLSATWWPCLDAEPLADNTRALTPRIDVPGAHGAPAKAGRLYGRQDGAVERKAFRHTLHGGDGACKAV